MRVKYTEGNMRMAVPEKELVRVKELLEAFCHERSGDLVTLEYHISQKFLRAVSLCHSKGAT